MILGLKKCERAWLEEMQMTKLECIVLQLARHTSMQECTPVYSSRSVGRPLPVYSSRPVDRLFTPLDYYSLL